MKLGKLKLDLKDGIKKEWIITNGIGGFCSSTVIGANTRRYHGLLVAALNPPSSRHLILSKLDESICIGNKNYCLYTNICKGYVSDGFKRLESFEKEYYPIFNYKVEDIKIEKKISMIYGKNTTVVSYKIKNEQTNGDTANVIVEIEVFDYNNALSEADDYIDEHESEFVDDEDETRKEKIDHYKINAMKEVTDKASYTINFSLVKDNKKWVLEKINDSDLEKIHGLYED